MSFTCGFFNAENGDRQYFNADLSNFLEGLIEDGIYAFIGDKMMVTEAVPTPNMTVNVGSGRAWFNGTWTKIDTAYAVNIPASDSVLSRIDALCLTVNKTRAVRDNYIEVIQGAGSVSNPTKPVVEDETNIFRHILCYVSVPAGCTAITQAQIENRIGMDTALFTTPKWGNVPTTEQMVAQWQSEFDQFMDHIHETFDYDAAGNLQVGVENLAPTYDPSETYVDGDMVLNNNVLKKRENGSFVNRKVSEELADMKSTFQDGVDAVYNACIEAGIQPSASTPTAIATALVTAANGTATVNDILDGKTALSRKAQITGEMPNQGTKTYTINPGGQQTIPKGYHSGSGYVKANPNQNSGTYTFPAGNTGQTVDLGVNNTYRYVNAVNVYSGGYNSGYSDGYTAGVNVKRSADANSFTSNRTNIDNWLDEMGRKSYDRIGSTWTSGNDDYIENRLAAITRALNDIANVING